MSESNGVLNRAALEAEATRDYAEVSVSIGRVRIQSINELERANAEVMSEGKERVNFRCYILAAGLVDGEGNRLFSDSEAELIQQWKAGVVSQLCDEILTLSGVADYSEDIDEQLKN